MLNKKQIDRLPKATIDALLSATPGNSGSGTNKEWTRAIFEALVALGKDFNLKIRPTDGPYKGEYLVDFVLWDEGYGPRLACECQWLHWRHPGKEGVGWAFDKLRGVKSDLKVLVFDADFEVESIFRSYLLGIALHYTTEQYIFVQFDDSKAKAFSWTPLHNGVHRRKEIVFELHKANAT